MTHCYNRFCMSLVGYIVNNKIKGRDEEPISEDVTVVAYGPSIVCKDY